MADYTPPNNTSIAFNFGPGGYSKPDFNVVSFEFSPKVSYSDVANLQASIEVMQLYQDSTYTYLKECKTIIIGYSVNGIQTLKLPCLYGGIRDIGAHLAVDSPSLDLRADIFARIPFLDLGTFQRAATAGQSDLSSWHRLANIGQTDLESWHRPATLDQVDLPNVIRALRLGQVNLSTFQRATTAAQVDLSSWHRPATLGQIDLPNLTRAFQRGQIDLPNVIRIFQLGQVNLSTFQRATTADQVDLSSWHRPATLGQIDLPNLTRAFQRDQVDLSNNIKGIADGTASFTSWHRPATLGQIDLSSWHRPATLGQIDLINVIRIFQLGQVDLSTFQRAALPSQLDLGSWYRPATLGQVDLHSEIEIWQRGQVYLSINVKSLSRGTDSFSSFVRQSLRQTKDLSTYMKFVRGYQIPKDLGAYIQDVQPVDLGGYTNVIEIRNLPMHIEGIYWKGQVGIAASFHRILLRADKSLPAYLFGWATLDLSARITSFSTLNLPAEINAGFFAIYRNLSSWIKCVVPMDLSAYIQSYDSLNLNAFTIVAYQPNDLQATIGASTPTDIKAQINAVFGTAIPVNLPSYIYGIFKQDLLAYIGVNAAKNLRAYIDAVGKYLDLEARIAPKTINIKRMLIVPLFEHKDLRATIQYSCKSSSYRDISSYIYAIRKLDLKAYIIGWFSGFADNVRDLSAHINISDHVTVNYVDIKGMPHVNSASLYNVAGGKLNTRYKTFDTYVVSGGTDPSLLKAYITGIFNSNDLVAKIIGRPIANFTIIPPWINPKTTTVVLNLTRFEERWTRFVSLMFFTASQDDYHYFYVSGENKIYKVDKNRTWQIHVTGYQEDTETIYERTRINKKYIFNLDKYNSMDEAIRDMIDRVTLYRSLDLGASIIPYDLDYKNLTAYVGTIQKTTWTRSLLGIIKAIVKAEALLVGSIQPLMYKDINNLTASIVGKSYEAPEAHDVQFIFEDPGYVAPTPYSNMNWTYKQAEKFWIYDEE